VTPRLALAAVLAVLALGITASALAQNGGQTPEQQVPENPCERPDLDLLCPDLRMSPPFDLHIDHRGKRRILRASNSINSRGTGPAELFATRKGRYTATATQKIWKRGGGKLTVKTGARSVFKFIPGQGRYWKFENAARFELWTVDGMLRPVKRVRIGPKQVYCLRDLRRTRPMSGSPRRFHYPGCNRSSHMRHVTLGTSVGWSDIYPSTYHENWIDVTGLHGVYAFIHTADPKNGIWESNENNNSATTIVRLPSGRAVTREGPAADNPY
jgi:hypothetical protein